jgi:cation transport ATPase
MSAPNADKIKELNSPECCGTSRILDYDSAPDSSLMKNDAVNACVSFLIDGMTCISCANKIENTLINHNGVVRALVDLSKQVSTINYDPKEVAPQELKAAIEAIGYGATESKKTIEINQNLPNPSSQNTGPYPYLIGMAAAAGVIAFYLGLLTLVSDWYNAKAQFNDYRWWIIALSIGFGVQATLFSGLRISLHCKNMKGAKTSMAASGGMSTASMAACCAHYLFAFLPALGLPFLSEAAAGLAEYQPQFFFLGVVSNLFGIGVMIRLMLKNNIISKDVFINRFSFGLLRSS